MSERLELTRRPPSTASLLDYSGADPDAALAVLRDEHFWFAPVKLWTDAPDLALAFARKMEEQHPAGCEEGLWKVWAMNRADYDAAVARGESPVALLEHPTLAEVEAWAAPTSPAPPAA